MGRMHPKPSKHVPDTTFFYANGYCVLLNHASRYRGAWYGITNSEECILTNSSSYPEPPWPTKKARRKALKHLFKLPKLN